MLGLMCEDFENPVGPAAGHGVLYTKQQIVNIFVPPHDQYLRYYATDMDTRRLNGQLFCTLLI